MSKHPRHQSVVSRQADANDDHWLTQFENNLQKNSVQARSDNLFDQINSIMNSKSKHPSVQAAVDDMMNRSGLNDYLENVKLSNENTTKKIAQNVEDKNTKHIPDAIKMKPSILTTLQNIITDSRGNKAIPTIISKLHSLHASDISDESVWEDEKLIRLVSRLNLEAKKSNPSTYESFSNLGKEDHSNDSDIDSSNTDAFNACMPARF